LRIVIILGAFYPVPTILGGAVEKVQANLAAAFAAAGHHVTMVSRRFGALPARETVSGVRHVRIASFNRTRSLPVNLLLSLIYDTRAVRAMPVADVTVTNSFFLPLLLPKRKAGKVCVHVARYPKGQFFLYRRADRFHAVSRAVAEAIARQDPQNAGKVVVTGNPVPEPFFSNDGGKSRTILFTGRLAREKGVELLIRAFCLLAAEAPDWRLRLVGPHVPEQGGDGTDYLHELKRLAAPLGSRCEFVGPIFDEKKLALEYAAAAIFVYPSIAERGEAFGLAPLEAMASGCAVLVSDLACFDDFIADRVNALKFDHRADAPEERLAVMLGELISDSALVQRLGAAGRVTAAEFRVPLIAARMLGDFQALLDRQDKIQARSAP